ncbi:DNA helicase [Niveispirillum lacus]|uniref:DEAD-box ATP-dependent RNA helicase RhpA n=1 Tax=Niveispirillum lacus TaxID=1981099 RepID=A0A255YY76_9PROT|nr:DEAD/DEAH box helicase [Niveispirillum lacus]OYQ34193.1 DNA helicase [Niveispirillum lacus]
MLFSELGLGSEVLRAVEEVGYTTPTPIQEKAIPWVLQGRDVLGCAQTGTGKTASFTLPMIEILGRGRAKARMPRSLILEPTRELAAQVAENFELYGKYHKLNMALLIGGESFGDQIKKLERGVDVLIATPGRMMDLFDRGNILLTDIKVLVIDEADRMLDMGFIPDIERIVSLLPRKRQTLFFSATMPPEIKRLADKFLTTPEEVTVSAPASTATTVAQHLLVVNEQDKREALRRLIATDDVKNAFIFCNRKKDIAVVHGSLVKHGFNAGALHGDMVQSKRTETLEAFKAGSIDLLVCSDVAARGIDISDVSHVFNFDTPHHSEDYVHRIGRTGRAGKLGRAFTIATPEDGKLVQAIEKLIGKEIARFTIEGIETAELSFDADPRRRGRGAPKKDEPRRSGRDRGERTERAPRVERPAHVHVEPEAAEAAIEAHQHKRERHEPRHDRNRDRSEPRQDTRPEGRGEFRRDEHRRDEYRRDRDDRRDRRPRRDEDDDRGPPVVGFGDDVPAFILRAARPPKVSAVEIETVDGVEA